MIQKKLCMVGMFATGKTSLVRQFVHSMFSEKYHSTVGVKIDKKPTSVDGTDVNLMLWDIEGKESFLEVKTSYIRGASGLFLVVDGTRRETYDEIFPLRDLAHAEVGDVPTVVALNKADLTEAWALGEADVKALADQGLHHFTTSAKSGDGVEDAFAWLAAAMVQS